MTPASRQMCKRRHVDIFFCDSCEEVKSEFAGPKFCLPFRPGRPYRYIVIVMPPLMPNHLILGVTLTIRRRKSLPRDSAAKCSWEAYAVNRSAVALCACAGDRKWCCIADEDGVLFTWKQYSSPGGGGVRALRARRKSRKRNKICC